jgi:hypothetical protein
MSDNNLRDTFAAAALTGLCSMPPMSGPDKPMDFARMAYCYADAMLAERSKIIAQCDTAQKLSESDSCCADADHHAVPATRAATLTDAEREAVEWCVEMAVLHATECEDEIAALRGLLERTK